MLACEPPVGGIRVARLAAAGPILVVENKATFDSAWRGLRRDAEKERPIGYAAVVFGGGDHAASLVTDLRFFPELVGVQTTRIDYAGDVDVAGVSAAAAFIDTAQRAGLAAGPAMPLWRALGAAPHAGEDLTGDEHERRSAIAAVNRLGLPDVVSARLAERVRVPQERLDRTAFADTTWWTPNA